MFQIYWNMSTRKKYDLRNDIAFVLNLCPSSLTEAMHCNCEKSTAKYGHHLGFPLRKVHQPHHCKPFTNLLHHKNSKKLNNGSRISWHAWCTYYVVLVSHIRIQGYCFVWSSCKPSNIIKLQIHGQQQATRTYQVQIFSFYKCKCNNLYH